MARILDDINDWLVVQCAHLGGAMCPGRSLVKVRQAVLHVGTCAISLLSLHSFGELLTTLGGTSPHVPDAVESRV
jgi:hypothetical protein